MIRSWTLWEIATLKKMAADKHSARQIGLAVGKSRNSIIGKANRLGVKLRNPNFQNWNRDRKFIIPKRPAEDIPSAKPATAPPRRFVMVPPTQQPTSPETAPMIAPTNPTTLLERSGDQCPYIIGEITCNSVVCGQPVTRGVYCERHFIACHHEAKAA